MNSRRPLTWQLDAIALIALGVPVIRYALSFQAAEPPLDVWGYPLDVSPITGLLFGLTYEYAVYMAIREAFRARRDMLKRWWVPLCGAGLQILAGVGIVAPVVEATHSGRTLTAVLGAWSWPWSIVLTGATVLTLVTLAITRALRKDDAPSTPPKRGTMPQLVEAAHSDAPQPADPAAYLRMMRSLADDAPAAAQPGNGKLPYACPYCGATADASGAPFKSSGAMAAHVRHHCQRKAAVAVATED